VHLTWSGPNAAGYRVSASQDAGPPQLLLAATTRTDAWFHLAPGHSYTFTVGALGGDGTATAVSAPLSLHAAQAAASLSLAAKPSHRTRRIRAVRFTAILRATENEVTTASRAVQLEVRIGRSWRNEGVVATDPLGRATWSLSLHPGAYAARARFGGGDDLAGTQSRSLRIVVPS
jgi:hypothetical protein